MRYTVMAALLATTLLSSPAWASVNAADFGVNPSSSDNADALQRAFDAARNTPDRQVILPPGNISYSRQLTANGVRIVGNGNTVMAPSNPQNQRIFLTGNSPSISDVQFAFQPARRNGGNGALAAVWVENATNFTVTGLDLDGAAYGTPPQGMGGGNIFVRNSQGGEISDNNISYALADSIHVTGGSRNIEVTGNQVDHSLDDSIAVVNYQDGTGGVQISDNTVTDNLWGRGITAVGASDVQIQDNVVSGNSANLAGIYVASEASYHTAAPRNVLVEGNVVQGTGGPGPGHGQIMLFSGNGPLSDVTVRDNEIRDSKRGDLALVVSGPMNNVSVDGNQIDGEISRRDGSSFNGSNRTNDAGMANPVQGAQSQLDRNLSGLGNNVYDTGDQFWNAVEQGDANATSRLNDLVSGGILVRQGNNIVNRLTGQVTSTVNRGFGSAVDSVMHPVEDAVQDVADDVGQTISCSFAGGIVGAAAGAVTAFFGGGRATYAMQVSQWLQDSASNLCQSRQLATANRQLAVERAMNARGTADNSGGITGMLSRTLPGLGSAGFLSNETQIRNAYEGRYPDEFPPMSGDQLVSADTQWGTSTRNAQMAALALQNRAVQEQVGSLERAAEYAAAGRDGPGIRAELQASNAIQGEQIAAINSLTAATVANHRADTEIQLRNEARKAAANATAEDFMSTLATCGNCTLNRPFLGN